MKEIRKPLLIDVLIGLAITVAVVVIEWQYGYPISHLLTDGLFVAAVVLLGLGGITLAINAGCFDMMGFSMKSLFGVVIPGARMADAHDNETFLDYKERKAEKRKTPAPLLISGAIYMAAALIMLVIYSATT